MCRVAQKYDRPVLDIQAEFDVYMKSRSGLSICGDRVHPASVGALLIARRIMEGVTAMSQGGWYTPDKQGVDRRGSINVLTCQDKPTPLAKGNPQHTNLVQVRPAPEDKL